MKTRLSRRRFLARTATACGLTILTTGQSAYTYQANYRIGNPLSWKGPEMQFTNSPEADVLLRREYRDGWTLSSPQLK